MLQIISNKEVRGPSFLVRLPNIDQVHFIEGDHVAVVEMEGGMGHEGRVHWQVYQETLQGWERPHQMEKISTEKRSEILSHIDQCLMEFGMPHTMT